MNQSLENEPLEHFIKNLHKSTKVLNRGLATVMGVTVDAVEVRNLYGQHVVWGLFSVERGKLKGKLASNLGTDGVEYMPLG